MILQAAALALLCASSASAVCTKLSNCPQNEVLRTSDCQMYHHFLLRGSMSPYPGHVIETVAKVCSALNTPENPSACGYEDIEYAALNGGEKWCLSAHEGAINGAAQMRNYTSRCPESHLIVMGFSQGGSVALDILGGGGGPLWKCTQKNNTGMEIGSAPGSRVAAALAWGPTRRSANQTWTVGGGNVSDGAAPRTASQLAGLQPYADAGVLREYCQTGDPICASHTKNPNMANHLNYFDRYTDEAAQWVIALARKANEKAKNDSASGAGGMLKKGIAHPVGNVFIAAVVVLAL
ncbi:carbohydrate esterase family 5 protein [Dothidotthia symphoricarpi CBS 119687]|uniref:Carbohydrate esterase family 5 protein n=1 Tax=Dothidotthia symphoricarpi CBS 119687 TaxID=1392245 RepID=A0A6A6APG3_9PLEO|nr:carbohydrate esterase family 5 protein [Dothidotthia symphoricarpi CBS 119687]KAF2133882.1 carbohydrate esterase family 5 protein [Dothidotthia symphoricarpi CBS 119687]